MGGGCLGSALAWKLASTSKVFCLDTDRTVLRSIKDNGVICNGRKMRGIEVASSAARWKGLEFDGVIFATKCADVKSAAATVARSASVKRVLFLQNGDFDLSWARSLFIKRPIWRGVTTMAVSATGPGNVALLHKGVTYIGDYAVENDEERWFEYVFDRACMAVESLRDYRGAVWAKLIFSAIMNPLPVLTGRDYEQIRTDKGVYLLVLDAMQEGKKVARALGIRLAFDPIKIVEKIRAGRPGSVRHMGSMYNDFVRKRPTEIDFITGAVVAKARALGVAVPVLEQIYSLIKLLEKHERGS